MAAGTPNELDQELAENGIELLDLGLCRLDHFGDNRSRHPEAFLRRRESASSEDERECLPDDTPGGRNDAFNQPEASHNVSNQLEQSNGEINLSGQTNGKFNKLRSRIDQFNQPESNNGRFNQSEASNSFSTQLELRNGEFKQSGQGKGKFNKLRSRINQFNQSEETNGVFGHSEQKNCKFNQPGSSKGGLNQPGSSNGDFNQSGSSKGGFNQPGSSNDVFKQPGSSKGGFNQPGSSKGGFNQPGSSNGDFHQSDSSKGGLNQPGSSNGDFHQSGSSKGDFHQSGSSKGGFNQPGSSNDVFNQSGSSNGGFNQSGSSKGGFNQPGSSNDVFNHSGSSSNGEFNQSGSSNGGFNQPGSSNGEFNQPGSSNGEFNQPGSSNGEFNQPGSSNGEFNQPGSSNGEFNQPGSSNGEFNQPGSSNGGFNQPGSSNGEFNQSGSSKDVLNQPGRSNGEFNQSGSSKDVLNQPGSSNGEFNQSGSSTCVFDQSEESDCVVNQSEDNEEDTESDFHLAHLGMTLSDEDDAFDSQRSVDTDESPREGTHFMRNTSTSSAQSYNKLAGAAGTEGVDFELYFLTLMFVRLLVSRLEFYLGSNMKAADKFDDIVAKYRANPEQEWRSVLFQLKHKQNADTSIYNKLLALKGDFSVAMYCDSFCKLKDSPNDELQFLCDLEGTTFILFTNAKLNGDTNLTENDLNAISEADRSNADSSNIFSAGGEEKYFPRGSKLFKRMCDWVDLKEKVCELDEAVQGKSEAQVKEAVKRLPSQLTTVENTCVISKIQDLLNKPTSRNIKDTLQSLQIVRSKDEFGKFLSRLRLNVSQLHGDDLQGQIKQLLQNVFKFTNNSDRDGMHHDLLNRMRAWHGQKETIITYLRQDSTLWQDLIKNHINTASTYKKSVQKSKAIDFTGASVVGLYNAIPRTVGGVLNVITDSMTTASLIRVVAALARSEDKEKILQVDLKTLLSHEDEVMALWKSAWCRSLVVECDSEVSVEHARKIIEKIVQVVEGHVGIKVAVIIGKKDSVINNVMHGVGKYSDSSRWSDLTVDSQERLLTTEVVLQGSKTTLSELVRGNRTFVDQVNGDVISQLLCGDTRCGKVLEPADKIYVSRRLVPPDGDPFDVNSVRDVAGRVVLVVAGPGMGKSTLMKHLALTAKTEDTAAWVLSIKLSDCTPYLATMDSENFNTDDAKRILEKIALQVGNRLEASLFRAMEKSLVVFVSGVDEVCPLYEKQVLCFLKRLASLGIRRLWVSSRTIMREKLERQLEVRAYVLAPFVEEDQQKFFVECWKQKHGPVRESEENEYKTNVKTVIRGTFGNSVSLLEVPLSAWMVAEVFDQDLCGHFADDNTVNMAAEDIGFLYTSYMEKKCTEELRNSATVRTLAAQFEHVKKTNNNLFQTNHQFLALKSLLDQRKISCLKLDEREILEKNLLKFIEDVKSGKEKRCVVDSLSSTGYPQFVNRTFAEYFVASWLSKNFKNNKEIAEHIIFDPYFAWTCDMFNRILAKEHRLHTAVLNRDARKVKQLSRQSGSNLCNSKDAGWRTPLHLAVLLSGTENKPKIIQTLLRHKASVHIDDKVLGWRPLRYADRIHAWTLAGAILSKGGDKDDMTEIKSKVRDTQTRQDFRSFLMSPPAETPGTSLMLGIARHADLKVVQYLVEERGGDVHCRGQREETMMHMAAEGNDVAVLSYLLAKGLSVDAEDKEYATPLNYAAREKRRVAVQFLVEVRPRRGPSLQAVGDRVQPRPATRGPCSSSHHADEGVSTLDDGQIEVVKQGYERVVLVRDEDCQYNAVQLAMFKDHVDDKETVTKIIKQGNEYLFIHDKDRFVGYGHFTGTSHLAKLPLSNVAQARVAIFEEFEITEIVCDTLSASRDHYFELLRSQLKAVEARRSFLVVNEINSILSKFEANSDGDLQILENISKNVALPIELQQVSGELFNEEQKIRERNAVFACFDKTLLGNLCLSGIYELLSTSRCYALNVHYLSLEALMEDTGNLGQEMKKSITELRNSPVVLRFSCEDIKVFKRLDAATKRFGLCDKLARVLLGIWNSFVAKVTCLEETGSLTTPVYPYLFDSFLETLEELCRRRSSGKEWVSCNTLLLVDDLSWDLKPITWQQSSNVRDQALEEECRFLKHLLEHAEPGKVLTLEVITDCQRCTPYHDDSTTSVEALIWTTVLRNSMDFLKKKSSGKRDEFVRKTYEKLLDVLQEAYASYVPVCDSFESCRVMAREIACFAAQMFDPVDNVGRPCDARILESQMDFMRTTMSSNFVTHLPHLIAEFVRYWEDRKHFDHAVKGKFTYEEFAKEIEAICDKLHDSLQSVLDMTKLAPDTVLDYLRLFNEFLVTFQELSFEWLVEVNNEWDPLLAGPFKTTVSGKSMVDHYKVTNKKGFAEALVAAKFDVPKHYVLAITSRLATLVVNSLKNDAVDAMTRVRGTGSLLEAVRKAFIYLDDQVNYASFEQFEKDLCQPFESVASKMANFDDFKRHLDNLENFFVYARRQSEIDIEKALEKFGANVDGKQSTDYDLEVLKKSFERYNKAFEVYISHFKEEDILEEIGSKFVVQNHSEWDTEFKKESVPELLAAVAAFWSLRESAHVVDTGNYIKPHIIQILCVLRLLNIDHKEQGLRKHLAEVLTGQGKSLVLGLLASVLALTGHSVQIVCYSAYLARRDQRDFKGFFEALGVGDKVKYGTFDDLANKVLRVDVYGGVHHVRDLLKRMILDELPAAVAMETPAVASSPSSVLLIDEVDVFFTQDFYGSVYGLCVLVPMQELPMIQEKIWLRVSLGQDAATIKSYIEKLVGEIAAENVDSVFSKFYKKSKKLFASELDKMIRNAMKVREKRPQKESFRINSAGIVTMVLSSGLYSTDTLNQYTNAFNYLRLKRENFDHKDYQNYGYLFIDCGDVSYAELPKEYPVILGVSGTISTLTPEENAVVRDSYGINDISYMPTFFGNVTLKFNPAVHVKIAGNESQWHETILQSVRQKQKKNRAVIVFFDNESKIDKFSKQFKDDMTGFTKLTGNEEASELERRIKDAGVAGSLTFAIRAMGRGVDYRTSQTVEMNGGIHVVQTFLSLDVKEETQIKGRTARKDNRGSYEMILCQQQLVADGMLKPEEGQVGYDLLNARRKLKASENYRRTGGNVAKALQKHKLSLKLIKSFETYHPNKRCGYFSNYPFAPI